MLHETGIGRRAFVAVLANTLKDINVKESTVKNSVDTTVLDFIQKGEAFSGVVQSSCVDPDILALDLKVPDNEDKKALSE